MRTVEYICNGPSSVSGLKSAFFCSVVKMYFIQPVIAVSVLAGAQNSDEHHQVSVQYSDILFETGLTDEITVSSDSPANILVIDLIIFKLFKNRLFTEDGNHGG